MRHLLSLTAALFLTAHAHADILYNEPSQGDLSGNRFAPTPLTLEFGSNQLIGFMAGDDGSGAIDLDYFSISIPAGMQLSQINCEAYFSLDPFAFLAIQPGPTFPNDPITVDPGDLFGWHHLNVSNVGSDVLPILGSNGQGFLPPLPAGTYSFWAQQLGDPTDYVLDFVITPAPATTALLLAAAAITARRKRST